MSENCIKKTYFGERGVANILISSNIYGEFSICLEDEQDGVKSSWEMIMFEEDAKKIALYLAKITGIVSLDATVNNTPTVAVNCKDCDGYEAGYSAGLKDAESPRDFFPMEIVAGKCPIEAGGDCPLKSQSEWIAVKDKLPPDTDDNYLVALEDGQIVVAHSSGIIKNHDFEPKMLAWQPLPEPYKEGGAE